MPPKKQKVLQQDDEPKVKKEAGVEEEEEEEQPRREGKGVGGGEGVVEALVASNSRLCAQAFAELERARVAEADVQQVRSRLIASEAQASVFQAEIRAKDAFIQAKDAEIRARDVAIQAKDGEVSRLQAEITRLQTVNVDHGANMSAVAVAQHLHEIIALINDNNVTCGI